MGSSHSRIVLQAPVIAHSARPGQFVSIFIDKPETSVSPHPNTMQFWHARSSPELHPCLLPRPFSIHRVLGDKVELAFKITGRGTRKLAGLRPPASLDIIGPLGKPFSPDPHRGVSVLVGGGAGLFPLFLLAEALRKSAKEVYVFGGAEWRLPHDCSDSSVTLSFLESDVTVAIDQFEELGCKSRVASERGAKGAYHGRVTDLLKLFLESGAGRSPAEIEVFACGPWEMLKTVARISRRWGIPCQTLLEQRMACGLGACMGCVVPTRATAYKRYKRVCREGAVFDAQEIDWDGT